MNAKKLAHSVLRKYWKGELPVDPANIAKQMGARVVADQMLGVSGQFQLEADAPVIRYNPNEPDVRQRFTIAHELGHYVLGHDGVFRDQTKNFSATNFDPREVAANRFAAEILMPETAVTQILLETGESDLRKLANQFNVSEVAMQYRLEQLGWIS